MSIDIALDSKSHDIIIRNGNIIFIDNAERVAQNIKIQLLTFYGEWFLDTTHGVPYLDYILVKNPNLTLVRQILREQILLVDDVNTVDNIDVQYDSQSRELIVNYEATTMFGTVTKKEVLGYGTL